ncbi:unnamed protein product [Arctia plantaginis]|uniref:Uncharacterized protein n=1 Tax=Arctia plantaginis TaxID=874455 RepID=A0A8S0YZF1_ARCPL|nr:unnamed protein product [Arctia plantaginis]
MFLIVCSYEEMQQKSDPTEQLSRRDEACTCKFLPKVRTGPCLVSVQLSTLPFMLLVGAAIARFISSDLLVVNDGPVNQIANITYGVENINQGSLTSIFSPRMDFDQWKPLTGRGDPLRNDPTYDYEPPVLDRVHYWADETRLEREHYPERKSEVLMLGVSSRKPSVTSRQPPLPSLPPRRHMHRPLLNKYEDFTYKLSDHYPMTILVPPPPPPPGHQPPLFVLPEDKLTNANKPQSQLVASPSDPPQEIITDPTTAPEYLSSFYALQESNLIYQSSTTQNWITNDTKSIANQAVSSDYAGWGPTTPVQDNDANNETFNFISKDHVELSNHPYSFYKPMSSEPLPKKTSSPLILSTFLPTVLPPTTVLETTTTFSQATWPTERTTDALDLPTEAPQEDTTESDNSVLLQQTPIPTSGTNSQTSMLDMLRPMMTMPMVNGPERPEDNLYAHASENIQVFNVNEHNLKDIQIETMQTMQPPPPIKPSESSTMTHIQQFHVNSQLSNKNPTFYTHGPYLHARFTTPIATTIDDYSENIKQTTELPTASMYLIIQGHSKVKTYGSKPKESESFGSIEIQETDLGIKYDVSDGSNVPIEVYRKGIVDNDQNDYSSGKIKSVATRIKRQIDLEDLMPFDEDDIEEYVFKSLEGKKNETSITGLIAQAVTSDAASAVDELDNEDDILEEER